MASRSRDSIRLSTYDELFSPGGKTKTVTLRKLKSVKRRSVVGGKNSELVGVLQKQRVLVDERAIHFVAEARDGKRADARNSVFKLAQRYQVLPDCERMQKIKQLYGKVKENEESGDEEWDKSSANLPGKMDGQAFLKLVQKDDHHEHLLTEIEEINQETQDLGGGIVTQETIQEEDELGELKKMVEESGKKLDAAGDSESQTDSNEEESSSDEDVSFDEDDLKTLNSMQREFVGNNLMSWFKDIQKAYESGVKLVKVNRMGYKFIRIVNIKDMLLSIRQPTTKSQAKVDRQVAIHSIVAVRLGRSSKEFDALEGLVERGEESRDFNPQPTCCAVVDMPKGRSLSLVFLEEDNRNGFVFYLRVLMKKACDAAKELAAQA